MVESIISSPGLIAEEKKPLFELDPGTGRQYVMDYVDYGSSMGETRGAGVAIPFTAHLADRLGFEFIIREDKQRARVEHVARFLKSNKSREDFFDEDRQQIFRNEIFPERNLKVSDAAQLFSFFRKQEDPPHWKKEWGARPKKVYFKTLEKMLSEHPEYKDGPGWTFIKYLEHDDRFLYENFKVLKAFFYRYPYLASACLLSLHGDHWKWHRLLEQEYAESSMIAAMTMMAIDIYNKDPLAIIEKDGVHGEHSPVKLVNLAELYADLNEGHPAAILSYIDDDHLAVWAEGLIPRISDKNRGRSIAKMLVELPLGRLEKLVPKLSVGNKKKFREVLDEKYPDLPWHWDNTWPVPDEKYFQSLKQLMSAHPEISADPAVVFFDNVDDFVDQSVTLDQVRAEVMKAMFFKYPDLCGKLFLELKGKHENLADLVEDADSALDRKLQKVYYEGGIPGSMFAAMIKRAFEIYRARVVFGVQHVSLADLGKLFVVYLSRPCARKVIATMEIPDRQTFVDSVLAIAEDYKMSQVAASYLTGFNESLSLTTVAGMSETFRQLLEAEVELEADFRDDEEGGMTEKLVERPGPEDLVATLPYVKEKIVQVPGRGVGRLRMFEGDPDSLGVFLKEIPPGNIIVSPAFMKSPGQYAATLNGIITFSSTAGAHSLFTAQGAGIPYVLWPGPEELKQYDGQIIELVAKKDGTVSIRLATDQELEAYQKKRAERVPENVVVPVAEISDKGRLFLLPGDKEMKDNREVGNKAALLNILAGHAINSVNPHVTFVFEQGAALPYRTFQFFLDRSSLKLQYMEHIERLKRTFVGDHRPVIRELKEITGAVVAAIAWRVVSFMAERGVDPADWFNNVFVRCTFNMENPASAPRVGSGTFKTVENVMGAEAFQNAMVAVYESLWSDAGYLERQRYGISHARVFPAVWFVKSRVADYSIELQSEVNDNEVIVNVAQGQGGGLMSDTEKANQFPTRIVIDRRNGHIIGTPSGSTMEQKKVFNPEGGMMTVRADPAKEFLDHPGMPDILKALAEAIRQIHTIAAKEKILANGFQLEAGLKFSEDGKSAVCTILQVIDLPPLEHVRDAAQAGPGGIDLTRDKLPLDVQSAGSGTTFNFDPAMAARFENAAGFTPVILGIQPMTMSLPAFLDLQSSTH